MTMNRLFEVMTNMKSEMYQVNAQNAPGARLLWITGKTRLGFWDPTGTEPHPYNIYAAVVAASRGEWIFYVNAYDAGTLTELMRALRLTTT